MGGGETADWPIFVLLGRKAILGFRLLYFSAKIGKGLGRGIGETVPTP